MYLEHFKLKELPFRLSPDPLFLYPSQIHSRAKAYMESTIWFTDGFVVITGEIGAGKTTLIESFLKEIDQDVVVAQINQTQVSPIEFLQGLLAQFGFSPFRMRKAELLATLNNFLIEQYANGRKVLLIVDEAQNLSNKVLEEVRLLSGVETTKEKVLRIILAGQPELNAKLDSEDLIQLRQRVRLRFHLSALTEPEMGAYIRHRLAVAGAAHPDIFAPETFPLIFRYTGGIPRLTNTLCDTCMLAAFGGDLETIDVEVVQQALAELQWQEYTARTQTNLPTDAHRRDRAAAASAGGSCRAHDQGCADRPGAARPWPLHHRPHDGQRHAGRQQVRQPAPHAAHHVDGRLLRRGPEQHQRRLPERQARAPAQAASRRRDQARDARDHLLARRPAGRAGRRHPRDADDGAAGFRL